MHFSNGPQEFLALLDHSSLLDFGFWQLIIFMRCLQFFKIQISILRGKMKPMVDAIEKVATNDIKLCNLLTKHKSLCQ